MHYHATAPCEFFEISVADSMRPSRTYLTPLGMYSQAEVLSVFRKQSHPEFLGGAKLVYEAECLAPELLSGKEVILVSV